MMGRQHTCANTSIVPVSILAIIFYLGFGLEYLLSIPVGIFVATLPDMDEYAPPKRWRTIKFLIQALILFIGLAAVAVIIQFFYLLQHGNHSFAKYALYAFIILVSYFAIYAYSKSKNGKFLFAHRGFTHTLIPSILLYVSFRACRGFIGNENIFINYGARLGCIILIGVLIGVTGHILVDLCCKAGCPILWPITKKTIHIGNAITSDPKQKDGTHISSKIWTGIIMTVFYGIGILMILIKFNILEIGFLR